MSERWIPYGCQWVDDDDVQEVVAVLQSAYLTTGPAVARFEAALATYTGAVHAVAVNSGTAALHAAYFAANLQPGEAIITSPLTFVATANAARYLQAHVIFVDIEPDTGNIDPEAIAAALTPETRLLVPVDYAGHPAEYTAIRQIAHTHGLQVVADAAHAVGATYRGQAVGTLADLTTTSFHPVKPITMGEGGAVLTADPGYAQRVALFRTHGITRDPALIESLDEPWAYEMHALGYNYRATDIQCALGYSQLRRLDTFLARRRHIAAQYTEAFRGVPGIRPPVTRAYVNPGWHLYVVQIMGTPQQRRLIYEVLHQAGVGVQVHYLPVYWHPYYQHLGYRKGMCPRAEVFYARALSLPIYPKMTDDEVAYVIDHVARAAQQYL